MSLHRRGIQSYPRIQTPCGCGAEALSSSCSTGIFKDGVVMGSFRGFVAEVLPGMELFDGGLPRKLSPLRCCCRTRRWRWGHF